MYDKVYLIDLERTKSTGEVWYWKNGGRGYTRHETEAGLYLLENALGICENDIKRETAIVPITNK